MIGFASKRRNEVLGVERRGLVGGRDGGRVDNTEEGGSYCREGGSWVPLARMKGRGREGKERRGLGIELSCRTRRRKMVPRVPTRKLKYKKERNVGLMVRKERKLVRSRIEGMERAETNHRIQRLHLPCDTEELSQLESFPSSKGSSSFPDPSYRFSIADNSTRSSQIDLAIGGSQSGSQRRRREKRVWEMGSLRV